MKTVGGFRRTLEGRQRTQLAATVVGAAYNLLRACRLTKIEVQALQDAFLRRHRYDWNALVVSSGLRSSRLLTAHGHH